jgi:hypothetical protein
MKIALAVLALAACTPDIEPYKPLDVQPARSLDVLFVIDDSPRRGTYDAMAQQLDTLTAQLTGVDGALPSLHVGVVSTDLGTSSTLDALPAWTMGHCAGFGKAGKLLGYLADERAADGSRTRNFDGDLKLQLAALTDTASMAPGCEYPQPLEAMKKALDPAVNPGFLRDDALLAVVFLTSEDDCSLAHGATVLDPADNALGPSSVFRCVRAGVVCDPDDPTREGAHASCRPRAGAGDIVDVADYTEFLEHLKADPRDVVVSTVGGPRDSFYVRWLGSAVLDPSCSGPGGDAYPAVRLGAVADHFGGGVIDGCTQANAYEQITAPIVDRQRACFPALLAADGSDCTVMETAGAQETEIPPCADAAPGRCWYEYADAHACPDGDNLAIGIRGGMTPGAHVQARCFVR